MTLMNKKTGLMLLLALMLGACQSLPADKPITSVSNNAPSFAITGKIGITTQAADTKRAASAFYTWSQEDERFAIELTGILGMGATSISFDGKTAKLLSDHTGEIVADSPETLLLRATGHQAPISQLPYWIVGRLAPDDVDGVFDGERLIKSSNHQWSAVFNYGKNDKRPNRLTITHTDGHKVVMTIAHPHGQFL